MSYKLRPWYRGDISSDDEEGDQPRLIRPRLNTERLELPSDPPSDPATSPHSSYISSSPDTQSSLSSNSPTSGAPKSQPELSPESPTSQPELLPRSLPELSSESQRSLPELSSESPTSQPELLQPDISSPTSQPEVFSEPQSNSQNSDSSRASIHEDDVLSPPEEDSDIDEPGFLDQSEEKDYYELLDEVSRAWLDTELDHKVSKTASNIYWQIACTLMIKVFEARKRQNITKKISRFQQIRRNYEKKVPDINMKIGYIRKDTGELIVEENLQCTPVKAYPPSLYKKAYEIASVKVSHYFSLIFGLQSKFTFCFCFHYACPACMLDC